MAALACQFLPLQDYLLLPSMYKDKMEYYSTGGRSEKVLVTHLTENPFVSHGLEMLKCQLTFSATQCLLKGFASSFQRLLQT